MSQEMNCERFISMRGEHQTQNTYTRASPLMTDQTRPQTRRERLLLLTVMSACPSSSEVSPAYSRPASTVSNCPSYSPAVFAALVVATRSSSAIVGGPVHCAAGAHVAPGEAVHCAAGAHVAPGDAVQGTAGAHVAPSLEHRGGGWRECSGRDAGGPIQTFQPQGYQFTCADDFAGY